MHTNFVQRSLVAALLLSLFAGCGSSAAPRASATTTPPVAPSAPVSAEQCGSALGPADGAILYGSIEAPYPDEETLSTERVWLASGAFVQTIASPADQAHLVHVSAPIEGWFEASVHERCETRALPWSFPSMEPTAGPRAEHTFQALGRVAEASAALGGLVGSHANAHLPPLEDADEEDADEDEDASVIDSYWVVDPARFVVARTSHPDRDGFSWHSLLATETGWALTETRHHAFDFSAEGSADLDRDGVADAWVLSESPDFAHMKASVALSRSRRVVDMELSFDESAGETPLDGCFAYVDGRLSYVLAFSAGPASGFRVLKATDSGERLEPVAGLLGHLIGGVGYDAQRGLVGASENDLFEGSDAPFETMMRLCPDAGTAIDVPRDGHYPIEGADEEGGEEGINSAVVIRVRDLATSHESLEQGSMGHIAAPVGPVVEMRTASH